MTKEQQESYENAKICYICKEKFEGKYIKDKKYCKHCAPHGTIAHVIQNIVYLKKFLWLFIIDLTMIIVSS